MKLKPSFEPRYVFMGLLLAMAILLHCSAARANVYATNIKLNGGSTNTTTATGEPVVITYILNEPATAGVEIDFSSGGNVVRKLTVLDGDSVTNRGLNSVLWTNDLPSGEYQVSITAAATGYTNWTQITSEDDPGAYVRFGNGISVDRNPSSLYYGRVFVANSEAGPSPDTNPGDNVGILKLNADASFADEGASSAGLDGRAWTGNDVSPWKVRVSDDEFVYVSDLALSGQVFRWDPLILSNSLVAVLRDDNIPNGAMLSGPAILGTGTNTQVWMSDTNGANGILRWLVATNGLCATNDLGQTIVGIGSDPTNGLSMGAISVSVDKSGNIYTCQAVTNAGDPTARVFRFPAYNPSTNGGAPELAAAWAVGENDDTYASASGIAVDPTGTYVAVAFQGLIIDGLFQGGSTKVLYTTNGALAANLDLGLAIGLDANHQDIACDWDAVGNVYCVDNWFGKWRAFSPPGTNQSTTVAMPTIQVTGGTASGPPPTITKLTFAGGTVTIDFTATTSDTPSSFLVVGAANVLGPYTQISNATITQLSPGVFRATLTAIANMQYFRIQRQGSAPPPPPSEQPTITGISISGATITLDFTALTTDTPSGFLVLAAAAVTGPYNSVPGATISQVSPGVFRATLSNNGNMAYFRIQRQGGGIVTPPSGQAPQISSLTVSSGTATLTFTGSTTDSASQFTLLSASSAGGPYASAAGASITQVSSGVFRASAPANGPVQFYRLQR